MPGHLINDDFQRHADVGDALRFVNCQQLIPLDVSQNLAEVLRTQNLLRASVVARIELIPKRCLREVVLQQRRLADPTRAINDQDLVGLDMGGQWLISACDHGGSIVQLFKFMQIHGVEVHEFRLISDKASAEIPFHSPSISATVRAVTTSPTILSADLLIVGMRARARVSSRRSSVFPAGGDPATTRCSGNWGNHVVDRSSSVCYTCRAAMGSPESRRAGCSEQRGAL